MSWLDVTLVLLLALPAILVTAFLASRLLGVSRSWVKILMSGVLGYGIGIAMAFGANDFDPGESGLIRDVFVLSIVITMLVAVTLDLLAKPGSLAKGDEAGLIEAPRPIRDLKDRLRPISRYREIVLIARRNGFGPFLGVGGHDVTADHDSPVGVRLRQTLEACGGMFVKLGQVASTRTDLLPVEITTELAKLQSSAPPAPADEVRALLEEELGAPVETVFASFEWEPVAAASIAQAHAARLEDGTEVIVKVQRPGVGALVRRDVEVLLQLAGTAQRRTVRGRRYDVLGMAREFSQSLAEELDFTIEARNALAIAANIADDPDESVMKVPKVYPEFSTRRVMVQERLPGVPLGDDPSVLERGIDTATLADELLQSFLHQMLVDGLFHADPHPGNLFILDGGRIGLIDFGATGILDPITREALQQMVLAVMTRDAYLLRQAVGDVTVISPDTDQAALERALSHFMAEHVQPGAGFDARVLNDLTPFFADFGVNLPVGLSTFGRTLVTLEGTLRLLAPDYSISDGIQKLADQWVQDNVGEDADLQELARKEIINELPILRRLPRRFDTLSAQLATGEFTTKVRLYSHQHDKDFVATLVNRALLAFIGAAVALASVALIIAEAGPELAGETTLLNAIGYLGLLAGSVLMLRVVAAVVRDGLT